MNTILCALAVLLAVLVVILLWATETLQDFDRRWHRAGMSQRAIAGRLNVSRHRIRGWVTV